MQVSILEDDTEHDNLITAIREPENKSFLNVQTWLKHPLNGIFAPIVIFGFITAILLTGFSMLGHFPDDIGGLVCPDIDMPDLVADLDWNLLSSNKSDYSGIDGYFEEFKLKFGKTYRTAQEESYRAKVFLENFYKAQYLNSIINIDVQYGVTKFSDLTPEEFSKINLFKFQDLNIFSPDVQKSGYVKYGDVSSSSFAEETTIPCAFDWREKGAVNPVQNQGMCGDCFSFATTGAIEGANFLKTGELVKLSEQQLTSCELSDDDYTVTTSYTSSYSSWTTFQHRGVDVYATDDIDGCEGGTLPEAFTEAYWFGLVTEEEYPFASYDGTSPGCDYGVLNSDNQTRVSIDAWTWVHDTLQGASPDALKRALVKFGPIAVGVNADQMQFYVSGIDKASLCRGRDPNHAMLLVGYGYSREGNYWLVKNSWGEEWGEQGYYRISTSYGACGIGEMAMLPLFFDSDTGSKSKQKIWH